MDLKSDKMKQNRDTTEKHEIEKNIQPTKAFQSCCKSEIGAPWTVPVADAQRDVVNTTLSPMQRPRQLLITWKILEFRSVQMHLRTANTAHFDNKLTFLPTPSLQLTSGEKKSKPGKPKILYPPQTTYSVGTSPLHIRNRWSWDSKEHLHIAHQLGMSFCRVCELARHRKC